MRWLALLLGIAVLLQGLPGARAAEGTRPAGALVIATASLTGVYYGAGNAICRLVDLLPPEQRLPCRVQETAGSGDNLRRLVSRDFNLGIAQSDVVRAAARGTVTGISVLGGLYPEVFQVVVRDRIRPDTAADLARITFNIGIQGSGQRATTEDFFRIIGFDPARFGRVVELDPAGQADAFCRGRIDAFSYVAGIPNTVVAMAVERCGGRLHDFGRQAIGQYVRANPATRWYRVRPNAYPAQRDTTTTFASTALLLAGPALTDAAAQTVVLALVEHAERFRLMHPAFSEFAPQTLTKGVDPAMLHTVARRLYLERGLLRGAGAK